MTERFTTLDPAPAKHLAMAVFNRLIACRGVSAVEHVACDTLKTLESRDASGITEALRIMCIRLNVNPEFFSL